MLKISRRTAVLSLTLLIVAFAGTLRLTVDAANANLSDVARIESAAEIPAVIFRYDTENCSQEQLQELVKQDAEIGIRASAFPLVEDFRFTRNAMQRYALESGEVQLHAKPMPDGLSNSWVSYNDPSPYQYDFLDKDTMVESYYYNLVHELAIFARNGFSVSGMSLHSHHNRLPWGDDINYRIIAVAAGMAGLDWLSVTSQAFSVGNDPQGYDRDKFNRYDREVTMTQKPFWVKVGTGWFASQEVLVIPTTWRDRYGVGLYDLDSFEEVFALMLEEIERQWAAAREVHAPLVMLFHPCGSVLKPGAAALHKNLRRTVVERARTLDIPIMTFSQFYALAKAAR